MKVNSKITYGILAIVGIAVTSWVIKRVLTPEERPDGRLTQKKIKKLYAEVEL